MDNTINTSRPATPQSQEITMPEINVQREMRRQREGNPELERRVQSLVGESSPTGTSAHRTTVHGPVARNNHR